MKIGILNEGFLTERHLEALKKLGDLIVFDNTQSEEDAINRLSGLTVAIADCLVAPLNKKVLESTDKLELITLNSTGFERVDVEAAGKKGIKIANVPGYATEAVAEHTLALIIDLSKKIVFSDKKMRQNPFEVDPTEPDKFEEYIGFNLSGKTLGIIGLGRIGSRVAEISQAFGVKVIANDILRIEKEGVEIVSKEKIYKESDIISLHVPLTELTANLINKDVLLQMKSNALIINTARGSIVNDTDLYNVLKSGIIAGAGLDVVEKYDKSNPLLSLDNVILTPHSAFYTKESLENCADIIVETVRNFIRGNPINIVS